MKKALIIIIASIGVLFSLALVEEKELFFGEKKAVAWSPQEARSKVDAFTRSVEAAYRKGTVEDKQMTPAMAPILEDLRYLAYIGQRIELKLEKVRYLETKRLSDFSARIVRLERWRRTAPSGQQTGDPVIERYLAVYELSWNGTEWNVISWKQQLTKDNRTSTQ